MTSKFPAVPSLRALAFNRLASRYHKFENKGREDQLVLILSKLPVTLIPELMHRKTTLDAVDAATDAKELVRSFAFRVSDREIRKHTDVQCEICDHAFVIEVEVEDDYPTEEKEAAEEEIERLRDIKRQKLDTHCLQKKICSDYGFEDSEDE